MRAGDDCKVGSAKGSTGPKIVFNRRVCSRRWEYSTGRRSWLTCQGEAHRSLASLLDVRLEEQALHLAPFMLLLALDRMQGELQGLRRS